MRKQTPGFPLITAQNQAELVGKALAAAPSKWHGRIPLLATKAVACANEFDRIDREILTEQECQFNEWAKVSQSPRVLKFQDLIASRRQLEGQAAALRRSAADKLAASEIEFNFGDLVSLEALHEAIAANVPNDRHVREQLGLNPPALRPSIFASGLAEASPIIFGALSAEGLSQVLSHRSILDRLGDPRTPFVVGIAGGITFMTFYAAHAFGLKIAMARLEGSWKESLKRVFGLVLESFSVLVPTAGLAGLDLIAVMSSAKSLDGTSTGFERFVPLVVLAFTTSGVVAKVMQGHREGSEARSIQTVSAQQSKFHAELLKKAKEAIQLIAEADSRESELSEVNASIADMEDELQALGFEANILDETLAAFEAAQDNWHQASEEFWRLAQSKSSFFDRIAKWVTSLKEPRRQATT